MADASARRAFIKLDRYALFQQARLHHLSAVDAWMLLVLTLSADYRTHECRCTARELAEDAQSTPTTAARSTERLATAGLVSLIEPLRPNGAAVVWVLAYDLLVVPPRSTPRSPDASIERECDSDENVQASGPDGRENARMAISDSRGFATMDERSATSGRCFECGGEADGRPTYRGDLACRQHEDF